jgi:hypothetical protein
MFSISCALKQGCQIFIAATNQSGKNIPKWPRDIPNGHETYQMFVKNSEWP